MIEAFTRWRARGGHRREYALRHHVARRWIPTSAGWSPAPDGVSLLGYVDKAELRRQYAGAAALLYPSIYEGFGLPIIEAMACGTPVVTSRTGSAPEIAGAAAILVDPFAVESIESGLEQVTQPDEGGPATRPGARAGPPVPVECRGESDLETYRRLTGRCKAQAPPAVPAAPGL